MITYLSTRGDKKEYTFSQVLLKGIAEDGGLFLPTRIPKLKLDDIVSLKGCTYQEIAFFVMKLLETDFPETVLRDLINKAYGRNFSSKEIAPLKQIEKDIFVLELWHGPTAAFKDMALQFMPLLFSHAIKMDKEKEKQYLILVATSGDTGAAALEGYRDKEGVRIIVLFPENQVSQIQELTMTTFKAKNAQVFAIKGDFDDCQTTVKNIFNDREFNEEILNKYGLALSAANSINWGRLVPQLIYFLVSYVRLLEQKNINLGDEIDVAVPSGNFGNLFAAYFMKQIGLPIRKFLCASNTNNVLTEFFETGKFDITARKIVGTPSPSMNILISSNLERFLYLIAEDSARVKDWMEDLKMRRYFKVDRETRKNMQKFVFADWVDNDDSLKCIKETFKKINYLIDPHTSVALEVVKRYKKLDQERSVPMIVCSTAHWSKFPEDVYKALFGKKSDKDTFEIFSEIKKKFPDVYIPENILGLQKRKKNYLAVLQAEKEVVEEAIINFLSALSL